MSNQYATSDDFLAHKFGVNVKDLGPGQLDEYLQESSTWVEEQLSYACVQKTIAPEYLYSDSIGRAKIANTGHVTLYPIQAYPIQSVSLLQWRTRGLPLASMSASSSSVSTSNLIPVDSSNYQIEYDRYGDGYRVRIFLDFLTWRSPSITLEFQLSYTGGYATDSNGKYPAWLRGATNYYCAHLIKSRGSGAMAMQGQPVSPEMGFSGGYMGKALDFLRPHMRLF